MKIGVVSDTHNFFDEQITRLLAGVEHIFHGGDIGQPRILHALQAIAPVTAVCGNTDDPAFGYLPVETLVLGGRKFLVQHIVDPHRMDDRLRRRLAAEKPQVVVFGHTHQRFAETKEGVFFFNPGYAGTPRFGVERSVGILHCDARQVRSEFFGLV